MISFRKLLLWFILFAMPFQGYAAATMALCIQAHTSAIESVQSEPSHGTAHDHIQHQHAGASVDDAHDSQNQASADADDAHKCATCGICHALALSSSLKALEVVVLPPAELTEPFNAVAFLAPDVLDKPPRA